MNQDLNEIFEKIKKVMEKYENPLVVRSKPDGKREYHLWSEKNLRIAGRKRKEVYFAGIIIQKNYVGLYYMPVYSNADIKNVFGEQLIKLLKGKSCFHIREYNDELEKELEFALETGFNLYKKREWI